MINYLLFAATVFIWGTTWIAIAWQLGTVDVIVSVFYRFALACVVFLVGLALLGRLKLPAQWRFVVLQALCLFSFNFLCFYHATSLMPSGLVSVIFSLATIFNAVNSRIFFGEKVKPRTVLAGFTGATGLVLLFWHDLTVSFDADVLQGIGWATAGTLMFSLGNMMSRKNSQHGVSPILANAWGMGIGALVLLTVAIFSGVPFTWPSSPTYIWSLVYLAVIGSVIGFSTYLLMVARLGSDRAAYATVLFPVVALFMSTLFEGYEWHATALAGIALTIAGNLIMFAKLPMWRTLSFR
ncbi:DMT family transporter [Parasedimentitalea maritima]|uniref:DMT family transporter n=1 Tax=Parasedimentitalea maritima TaxID=2578117 RepID=A0ABY2UUL9_9RHOB|nr:DMT family transporter [Zongyanglinia marina]TLP64395.1 DMT family transporter [Zongyanglinia marina]